MRKFVLLLCMAMVSFAAYAQNGGSKKTAEINGTCVKLLNEKGGLWATTIALFRGNNGVLEKVDECALDENRRFKLEVEGEGVYYVGDIMEFYLVYVRPGDVITLDLNESQVTYSGDLSKENLVFKEWHSLMKEIFVNVFPRASMAITYADYSKVVEKTVPLIKDFVENKINTGNASFDEQIRFMLPHLFNFNVLTFLSGPHPDDPSKGDFSPYFTGLMEADLFNSMRLMQLPFLWNYVSLAAFVKGAYYLRQTGDFSDLALEMISDSQLKAEAALTIPCASLDDWPEYEKKYKGLMVTEDQKERFAKIREKLEGLQKGDDAIDFTYPDMAGEERSLSDFKGSVVLVDVWATWCEPCKGEIPFLKKLEQEMEGKDVVFLSVSVDVDKDYEVWKKMIEDEQLGGIQLFASGIGNFEKDYGVKSIPRFMLFDKQGKVVDVDAPRPSNPELKALIEAELAK